jgi:hypothetical protein
MDQYLVFILHLLFTRVHAPIVKILDVVGFGHGFLDLVRRMVQRFLK